MKGLLLRLSTVDADAAAAVRVIAYFDALVEQRATPAQVVRAAAALAECPAGIERSGTRPLRAAADGAAIAADAPIVVSGSVELDDGRVWLERPGPPGPLDDLVCERFAIAARLLDTRSRRTPAPHLADPALVELVLSEQEAPEDRSRALRLLGLDSALPVRVIAVAAHGRDPGAEAVGLVARGRPVRAVRVAVIGDVAGVLLQPRDGVGSVVADLRSALVERRRERGGTGTALRVGVGGATTGLDARRSWAQARLALRFAAESESGGELVDHDTLGSLALLAQVPAEALRADPDVAALDTLAATPGGALDVTALEAFCRTGSLRAAATELHLHHSSVASRLAHVEDALEWRLDEPDGRFRAQLALLARRLAGQCPS